MYQLRSYQIEAVRAVIHYFQRNSDPAVMVLPTGAGKSLIIAELARLAKGRVLVLAHVKELVEQNHQKYQSYGLQGAIFSAGLNKKETDQQVIFASIQSVMRNLTHFNEPFSLVVIDECHRVSMKEDSGYQLVLKHLYHINANLKVLGLTATPFRLGQGWIYQYHTRGMVRSQTECFFRNCIFELPIHHLLDEGYLTPARRLDAPLLSYDFSQLKPATTGYYKTSELDQVIKQSQRATPQIVRQIIQLAEPKKGVMIFAATVHHAREIYALLPPENSGLILGETSTNERFVLIEQFKQQKLKFLVNVAVLTTGFDAPHVDLIAILRPTESVSLYQQIIGRGLRLFNAKTECLILDYAGNRFDLYQPEVGEPAPDSTSELVTIPCPACGCNNNFWGKLDSQGLVIEHYGRQCQGYHWDQKQHIEVHCGYRFRAKYCPNCGADNDIAAHQCQQCQTQLIDADKKLREALKLKEVLIFNCTQMELSVHQRQLKVTYGGENQQVHEFWTLNTTKQKQQFQAIFVTAHLADKHHPFDAQSASAIVKQQHRFRLPEFVIARKIGRFWRVYDKIFADELSPSFKRPEA